MEILIWIVAAGSLALLVALVFSGHKDPSAERLENAARDAESFARGGAVPADLFGASGVDSMGRTLRTGGAASGSAAIVDKRMKKEQQKERARERLVQAGLYRPTAAAAFTFFRIILFATPAVLGAVVSGTGLFTQSSGILIGLVVGAIGTMLPSFWLDHVKRKRQLQIQRALPDALDVMVICLEGGLSLPGAITRVAGELASAHPMLAMELKIVEREVQMGRTTGVALQQFAARFDLEELRSMASVVNQAEKFGSSVVRALNVFAETLRLRRQQRAEEMAQKAAVKVLFPTLLFIFPGIFIVILGPAAITIYKTLIMKGNMGG